MGFWHKQPPKSPFSKGDLTKSPLKKGARGLYSASIVKVAELLLKFFHKRARFANQPSQSLIHQVGPNGGKR